MEASYKALVDFWQKILLFTFFPLIDPIWTLDETSFDMAVSMGQNVLVDFYAPWCKACVIFAPKYQKAVQEAVKNGLDVTFAKVDTDLNPYLTQRFGVNTFPRLLLFPRSGARPKRYNSILEVEH